ncbi:MAG: class I SAM-dependent methyltransferase, partial [Prochlorococcaceae cyanobacterium]
MSSSYALGSDDNELQRLKRQHALWQSEMQQSWAQAGFGSGQRLLDVGCGPGFASLELAQLVGASGQVLGIDNAPEFLEHLQQQRTALGLHQLNTLRHDLASPLGHGGIEPGSWDGAWCRWVAMFVPQIEPMLDLMAAALKPGGMLVMHEYVQWDTFALYPNGSQLSRFVSRCIDHWRSLGGDPDVARRLPPLLEARGFRLLSSSSLMACSTSPHPKARWLDDF